MAESPSEPRGAGSGDRGTPAADSPVEEVVAAAGAAVTTVVHDLGGFIRAQREATQVSVRQLAKRAGVSNPYLSQIERGLRKPSAEVLAQIAKGLRLSAEVLYVQAGILEDKKPSPVLDAVLTDTAISERQKQLLMEIYESFRRENASTPRAPAPEPR
jgi:transcriptional regulator with XRE-family HTH domain